MLASLHIQCTFILFSTVVKYIFLLDSDYQAIATRVSVGRILLFYLENIIL